MKRSAKHVHRKLTPAEQTRVNAVRGEIEQEKPEIVRKAKRYKQEDDEARATLQEGLQLLKTERINQGLSLADLQKRTGIERPNLSRLENETDANPTIATLIRYAEALGKRLMIVLVDRTSTKSTGRG